jgi:hypothetical protein
MTPAEQLLRECRELLHHDTIEGGRDTCRACLMQERIDAHLSNAATQASPSVALTESSLEDAVKPVVAAPLSDIAPDAPTPETDAFYRIKLGRAPRLAF